MASKRPFCDADFFCPVCRDVFDHPVVLPCGHSGCKDCIEQYWRVSDSRQCPLCRQISANNPSLNLALRNLCQAFLDHRRYLEELCEVHHEKRTLVCCDDEQILCEICRESEEHRNHTCRPVQEIAEEHKAVLLGKLGLLKEKMHLMKEVNVENDFAGMNIQNFKDTLMRAECKFQDPEMTAGDLIDSVKYLGNFKLNVWRKVRRSISYSPVVLDPNTAHIYLTVSDNLTCVWYGFEITEPIPDNLERFDRCPCVLGSVGFSTGTHTWDVEVEHNSSWMVGVATESVQRKGTNCLSSGVWCIGLKDEILSVTDPLESHVPLLGFEKPAAVRVKLDLSAGRLSFSDLLCENVYHTFTHNFTETVFPFFFTDCHYPLTILPGVKPEEI
ncbi:zinc-binding protein A33 isoform X4 [Megalobrama amblycephala]|uniref:zinc-binding protein A33 isoform X4 n=1 Tax=Megalobrama amblycephala TaxID=75352 RepID=UPI002013CE6D|nr:zinc-binding protein A33 isoform X4 [Megalobrama amblycephala]